MGTDCTAVKYANKINIYKALRLVGGTEAVFILLKFYPTADHQTLLIGLIAFPVSSNSTDY